VEGQEGRKPIRAHHSHVPTCALPPTRTHSVRLDYRPMPLGFLPTTPLQLLSCLFLSQQKRLFLGPCWLSCSSLLLVRSIVCKGQWVLAVHSVLRTSQQELTCCLLFSSCFLYNPKFRQVDCSACLLFRVCFLLGKLFDL
jgi:hypothetical protein